mmetsp:Transcript_97704/g.146469  ORF Transcript_97704/g.146469 Transcript_97704/m.146469 type:complete len:125 (+) Transcript_97704:1020-1394(+)
MEIFKIVMEILHFIWLVKNILILSNFFYATPLSQDSLNMKNSKGNTSLIQLLNSTGVNVDAVQALVSHDGINVNLQNSRGDTALHVACKNKLAPFVKLLIDNRADPSITNTAGVYFVILTRFNY